MSFETKESIFEEIMSRKKPCCPHCATEMSLWEVPPMTYSDGLGWGVPYLFVCFNDHCSVYEDGWKDMEENYGHKASCRCMNYPGTEDFEFMPVFSPVGGTGQIIDDQAKLEEEVLKEKIKKGFSILADCYVAKDSMTVMQILLDATEPARVRLKAAEMIGDMGELEAIEPLRSLKFGNELIQSKVTDSVAKIHERYFTRECPFCAEIIKRRANICKHCNKEIAGI